MGKKVQTIYVIYYNLLTVQDLWQAYYQVLSIIYLQFIELNVNLDPIIKMWNVKLNFLEYINFNDDLIKYKWFAMFDLQYKSATI